MKNLPMKGGTGGCGAPTGRGGAARGANAAPGPQRAAADQEVVALADQRVGRPRQRHALRAQQFHSITGRLAPGAGHGCTGVGIAVALAPTRMAGLLTVAWGGRSCGTVGAAH